MSKWLKGIGVVAVVAAVTVAGLGALAYLRPVAAAASQRAAYFHGGGPGGLGGEAAREAAADALGMTVEELETQLEAGESLADLADAAGVDLQDVLDAVQAARAEEIRTRIEEAVTDGTITRDHADWLLEGLDAGYWGGTEGGFGFGGRGGGFGHFGGFGPRGDFNGQPPTEVTPEGQST